ncbi:MAG: twin-arginine translocase TatA/TatE family subunit [Alphaproteobacteria bacterium]|jgi:sec-independent protein translocase protein TatA|nr:twin-arginine translocase TatA/TatE family subunit [Alphaproteobacteria bacterium]
MKAGFWEILLVVILILILFGHSKIPEVMKNLAAGIKVFKKEIKKDDEQTEVKSVKNSKKSAVKQTAKPKKKAVTRKK